MPNRLSAVGILILFCGWTAASGAEIECRRLEIITDLALAGNAVASELVCFDGKEALVSPDCRSKETCPLQRKLLDLKHIPQLYSPTATPAAQLCRAIDGRMHLVRLKLPQGERAFQVCRSGSSFADSGTLYGQFMDSFALKGK